MANVEITQLPQGTPQATDVICGVDTTGTPTTKKFLFGDQVDFIGVQIQNQAFTFAFSGGTSTPYTVGFTPSITALVDGQLFLIQFNTGNSANPTIDIDGLGAIPIIDQAGEPLGVGAIPSSGSIGLIAISGGGTVAMLITQYPASGAGVSPAEVQSQAFTYGEDSSAGPDAYVVSFTPAMTVSDGSRFDVRINSTGTNTITNPTITVDGNVYTIVLNDGAFSALVDGDIASNQVASFELIAGSAVLLNPQIGAGADVTAQEVQNQVFTFSLDSGVADAYVGTYLPTISLQTGTRLDLEVANTNLTTTPTFDCGNGSGALPIVLTSGAALSASDMVAGGVSSLVFVGTQWQLLNPALSESITASGALLLVSLSGDQTGIGALSTVDIQFDTAALNVGGAFDTSTYTWTSPFTGWANFFIGIAGNQGTATSSPSIQLVSGTSGIVRNLGTSNSISIGTTYFNGVMGGLVPVTTGETFKVTITNLDSVEAIALNVGQPATYWSITDGGTPSSPDGSVIQTFSTLTTALSFSSGTDQLYVFDAITGPTSPITYDGAGTFTIPSGTPRTWEIIGQFLTPAVSVDNMRLHIATPLNTDFYYTSGTVPGATGGSWVYINWRGSIQAGSELQVLFDASGSGTVDNGSGAWQGITSFMTIREI